MDLTVKNGDHAIHARVDGLSSGPVLLLVHPLGGSTASWDPQMPALEGRFRVIRYDARGHGASAPSGPATLDQLGSDALAVLDAVGAETADVCGLSLGGQVVLWLAINHPTRVNRAVVANASARVASAEVWNARIGMAEREGMAAAADAGVARWFTKPFAEANPDIVEQVRAGVAAMDPRGYIACSTALRDADQNGGLPGITAPTLVIVGAQDLSTPPEFGRATAARIPGAQVVQLDCGHLSNIEMAEGFNRALLDFLTP